MHDNKDHEQPGGGIRYPAHNPAVEVEVRVGGRDEEAAVRQAEQVRRDAEAVQRGGLCLQEQGIQDAAQQERTPQDDQTHP